MQQTQTEHTRFNPSRFEQACQLQTAGEYARASHIYSDILKQDPTHLASLMNLGAIKFATADHGMAQRCFSIVISIDPDHADAYYNRGCSLHLTHQPIEAEADYRACLALQSEHQACLENLISLLSTKNDSSDELLSLLDRRLQLGDDKVHYRLVAEVHARLGATLEAKRAWLRVLEMSPLDPMANYFLSAAAASEGQFHQGALRARWSVPEFSSNNPARAVPLPEWNGEALDQKHIFIAAEQGLGDEIMFASALTELDAGTITVEAEPRLVPLYQRSFPHLSVVATHSDITQLTPVDWSTLDVHCLMSDLPALHQETQATGPWLKPDPNRLAHWQNWLEPFHGLKVGLSWRGGSNQQEEDKHSMTLGVLIPLLQSAETRFVSIQYDPLDEEIAFINEQLARPVLVPPGLDCRNNIDDLAALIAELDLVITIDNATCYLAAAIGTPTWVALPVAPDWRWMSRRKEFWQANIRTFRSHSANDWGVVVEQMTDCLPDCPIDSRSGPIRIETKRVCPLPSVVAASTHANNRKTTLIINDSINANHYGHGLVATWLYQQLIPAGHTVTRIPTHTLAILAGSGPSLDEFANLSRWHAFTRDHPRIAERIRDADRILVNGAAIIDGIGLLYLAFAAARFENKPVAFIHHALLTEQLDDATVKALAPIYSLFDWISSTNPISHSQARRLNTNCLMSPYTSGLSENTPQQESGVHSIVLTSVAQTTQQYVGELQTLLDEPKLEQNCHFNLLVGSRTAITADDQVMAEMIQASHPGRLTIAWAHSEANWLATIQAASCLVSGDPVAVTIARSRGVSAVIPGATPQASKNQCELGSPHSLVQGVLAALESKPQRVLMNPEPLAKTLATWLH